MIPPAQRTGVTSSRTHANSATSVIIAAAALAALGTTSLLGHDDLVHLQNCQHSIQSEPHGPLLAFHMVQDALLHSVAHHVSRFHLNACILLSLLVCGIQ